MEEDELDKKMLEIARKLEIGVEDLKEVLMALMEDLLEQREDSSYGCGDCVNYETRGEDDEDW